MMRVHHQSRASSRHLLLLRIIIYLHLAAASPYQEDYVDDSNVETALRSIHSVSSYSRGQLCVTKQWLTLPVGLRTTAFEGAKRQTELAAAALASLSPPSEDVVKAITDALSRTVPGNIGARVVILESSKGTAKVLRSASVPTEDILSDPSAPWREAVFINYTSDNEDDSDHWEYKEDSSKIVERWSLPHFSCPASRWLQSFSILIKGNTPNEESTLVSLDIDLSHLEVNQCDEDVPVDNATSILTVAPDPLEVFRGTHKCYNESTKCVPRKGRGWSRGAYVCVCRDGFYSPTHPQGFNGSLVEVAWQVRHSNGGWSTLQCLPCAEGCETCKGPQPCLASYNWPFRTIILGISLWCAGGTILLAAFLHRHRRAKVFRSASPVFLAITLFGCAIMYLEMAAIFPVLDTYSCILTKWCRHLGFCITYTALLMKTWRVSLTYRVKSAHAVKLTERQLLRWVFPVLLVALVYMGTWTLSDPPHAEVITDKEGLKFKQCTYNWWDHSLAIGELAFLLWGIKVCYGVRHAESLYNEARLISYAIYNIAAVNCLMLTFHLLIFPQVGPDMKYFLGFVRTQLSTSVTVALVFGPKVVRIWRGFGDQWDNRAARGVSASFSLNGIGSIHPNPPTPHDLAQENDELKEEIQKLAAQIEFMKIVQMELHNRHLKPRPGGHFTLPPPLQQCPQPQQISDEVEKEIKSENSSRGG